MFWKSKSYHWNKLQFFPQGLALFCLLAPSPKPFPLSCSNLLDSPTVIFLHRWQRFIAILALPWAWGMILWDLGVSIFPSRSSTPMAAWSETPSLITSPISLCPGTLIYIFLASPHSKVSLFIYGRRSSRFMFLWEHVGSFGASGQLFH